MGSPSSSISVERSPTGFTELLRAQHAAHDLAAARPRQRGHELDLLGHRQRRQPAADGVHDVEFEVVARLEAALQRHERLHHLHVHGIRLGHGGRLGHRRVFQQGRLDLEGPHQVPRRVDHVVVASDEPEVAVGVHRPAVAADVPPVAEPRGVAVRVLPVGSHHRRPPGAQRNEPDSSGLDERLERARVEHGRGDAGERLPHRPGLMCMPGKFVMTMQPVSVCQ